MILQQKKFKPMEVVTDPISIGETLTDLKTRDYHLKFRREATCLHCIELNSWITPDSFTVDEYYHFEDGSNPDEERTIYAISSIQGIKGFLIDTCLVYEDNISLEMMQKLNPEPALT